MRQISTHLRPVLALLAMTSPLLGTTISREVLLRDHLKQSTSIVRVTGTLHDSTTGSWIGTRPGIDGLPTPAYDWTVAPIGNRRPLSPVKPELGWPARIAGRLDMFQEDSSSGQQCSGILVGPRHFLTAAHCVLSGQDVWHRDRFCVRPGFNLKQNAPGYPCVRVVTSTLLRTALNDINSRVSDDDWALLELADDVGTELGWAQIVPIHSWKSGSNVHALGYPEYVLPTTDPVGDTSSKTDTLCHSWAPLYYQPDLGSVRRWTPDVPGWPGESGSPVFSCPSASCRSGPVRILGTRWTAQTISSIDSVNSGILAALLKDVRIPTAVHAPDRDDRFELEIVGSHLLGSASTAGEWRVLSLDGRSLLPATFGRNLSVPLDRLPSGVALVVFRETGRAAVVRRWVRR